jgi:hypothetical protein
LQVQDDHFTLDFARNLISDHDNLGVERQSTIPHEAFFPISLDLHDSSSVRTLLRR